MTLIKQPGRIGLATLEVGVAADLGLAFGVGVSVGQRLGFRLLVV